MQTIQNLRPADFTIAKLDAELQCMALIRSLPEEYQHLSMSLLLKDELDKSIILNAFRSDELNCQRHTQAESLNQAKAGGKRGYKGKGRFQKQHKEHKEPKEHKKYKEYKEFKDMSQVLCFICQELGHMSHNCPRVQDRKVARRSEDAKKTERKKAAVMEFAGQTSAITEHKINSTSSNVFHWNANTGATSHMTPHKNWIQKIGFGIIDLIECWLN